MTGVAVAVPAPRITTVLPGRVTMESLRIVRTCGCGRNSEQIGAKYCDHSDCPLRFGRELNGANDAAGADCHDDESNDFSTVSQQNIQDVT